jgi:predicted NBD/HSP70 family sugar kinase
MRVFLDKEVRLSEKERRNLSILNAIRKNGEVSRAEISKETDLNIVTVSNYVSKYVNDKIVFETGLDISSGGRRPELLRLNTEYRYSIGIDLGSPHLIADPFIVIVILDMTGKVVAKEKIRKEKESFDKLAQKVVQGTASLVQRSGVPQSKIHGIGVGIWGVLDRFRGMVRYAVEEENIVGYTTLLDQLEAKFNVPAIIEHDATLGVFGEKWSGAGAISGAENIIFMCSDSSCGMIIKGELYYGAGKSAGELNLSPPRMDMDSSPSKCWSSYEYGCCLRSRGIDLGITEKAKALLKDNKEPASGHILRGLVGEDIDKLNFSNITDALEKGDDLAKMLVEEAGDYLGVKMAFLINLFNPEVIIVGRGIEKAGDTLLSAVRKSVRRWAYEESVKIAKILPASLGEDAVAIGAAALITQDFFIKV